MRKGRAKIYHALSHPVRRRIVELLETRGTLGSSELKELFNIGPGKLYYHLENLGGLVEQDEEKRYRLSEEGKEAYHLLITGETLPVKEKAATLTPMPKFLNAVKSAFLFNWLLPRIFEEPVRHVPVFRYTIILRIASDALLRIKLHQLKISYVAYLKHQFLSKAIGSVMLPYEVRSMAYYLLDRKRRFPVTPKNEPSLSFRDILTITKMSLLLIVIFTVGLAFVNPLGVFYNISWLFPFYVSPMVIYLYSKAPPTRIGENPMRFISLNGGQPLISCFDIQPEEVHYLLSMRKLQSCEVHTQRENSGDSLHQQFDECSVEIK